MNTPQDPREARLHRLTRDWGEGVDGDTTERLRQIRQKAMAAQPAPRRALWQPVGLAASAAALVVALSVAWWPAGQPDAPDVETLAALASDLPALMEPEMLEAVDELVLMDAEALLLEMDVPEDGEDAA